MPLRIGINALFLIPGGVGGTEIYLRHLLAALAEIDSVNQYIVYVNRETAERFTPGRANWRTVLCGVRAGVRPFRIAYEQLVLPLLVRRDSVDILLNPGYTMPLLANCPSVVVFHDLQHKRHPEFFRRLDLPFWNILVWLAARQAVRIVAVSDPTVADLRHFMPEVADKIRVIPHGADPEFFRIGARRAKQRTEKYILAVSTLHPPKNYPRLLAAFALFRERVPGYRLVIAGLRGFATAGIEECIKRLKLGDFVTITGWIARAELYELFEKADAFVAPSLFEGFGLPLLEALAAGLPCACSEIPAFDRVGNTAAVSFDPHSTEDMADAMEKICGDDAVRLKAATEGPARARLFTWRSSAELTLAALTE